LEKICMPSSSSASEGVAEWESSEDEEEEAETVESEGGEEEEEEVAKSVGQEREMSLKSRRRCEAGPVGLVGRRIWGLGGKRRFKEA